MASFIASSACRGLRPKNVLVNDNFVREHLISKLMSQRSSLRFINAPDGFGKSTLVAQYADLVFSFKNVFWINCKSPCFIRDLDSEDIFNQIVQINDKTKLVIFDDLSDINEERKEKFSKLIDMLLDFNSEVICTSSIFNDSIVKYQPDSFVIKSRDLLLSQEEKDKTMSKYKDISYSEIYDIPIMAWSKEGVKNLLQKSINQSLPDALIFSLFYIYLFKNDKLSLLLNYIPKASYRLLKDIDEQYFYFGINKEIDNFEVPHIKIKDLLDTFRDYKTLIFKYFGVNDKNEFVHLVFNKFCFSKKYKKAIELMQIWGSKPAKMKCLEDFNEKSIREMFMLETSSLYESFIINKNDTGVNSAFHALRLAILGFRSDAIRLSYSILDNNSCSIDNKLFAALIFMRFGEIDERSQAIKIIRFLNNDFKIENYLKNSELTENEKFKCCVIKTVVDIYLAIYSENINPFEVWIQSVKDGINLENIIAAACIFNSPSIIRANHIKSDQFIKFISLLARHYNYGNKVDFNFYSFALLKSFLKSKEEFEEHVGILPWDLNNQLLKNYKNFERNLNIDKNKFLSIHRGTHESIENINLKDLKKSSKILTDYKNILTTKLIFDKNVPKLFIKVFGGLTAYLGDDEILETNFGRQNIKLICCILTIENGQEISKEKISSLVWPESDKEQQRINMNTHWSVFKKLLTLPNGSCPYLVRSQNSYKLNSNYFESDVRAFETLCTDLTMGPLDSESWFKKFGENPNLLNGDLLPSESYNSYIKNKRIEYKNLLVNALIAASERLLEAGEVQQSLWFANKALSRDATREDVYVSLMKAQIKAGQRTPAIETYMACKNFLEYNVGIKPSKAINEMYNRAKNEVVI